MTTLFEAMLEYAFAGRAGGIRAVRDFALQKARALGARDPEDVTQAVLFKLCSTPAKARSALDSLAARSSALGTSFEATRAGSIPVLSPDALAEAERRIAGYITEAIRNKLIDLHRRNRPTDALPESDRLRDATAHEEPPELLAIRARVLATIERDTHRPAWLDATVEAIEALATGERSMDELTAECVAADPTLTALPAEAARIRARNRLQQQHQRARAYLRDTISAMTARGDLPPDEASTAERWSQLLLRRQKSLPRASRRSES